MFKFLGNIGKNLANLELANGKTVRVPTSRVHGRQKEGAPVHLASVSRDKPTKGATSRARQAFDFYVNQGLEPHQAAGIIGNFMQESGKGLDPGAVGDKGTAFGIGQWRGQRYANLRRFAKQQGTDWKDFQTQLRFAMWEGQNTEKTAWNKLLNSNDAFEATAAMAGYERPRGWKPGGNPENVHGWNNRYSFARQVLDPSYAPKSRSISAGNAAPASANGSVSVTASGKAGAGAGGTSLLNAGPISSDRNGGKLDNLRSVVSDALLAFGESSTGQETLAPQPRDTAELQLALQEQAQQGPLPRLGEGLAIFAPTEKSLGSIFKNG